MCYAEDKLQSLSRDPTLYNQAFEEIWYGPYLKVAIALSRSYPLQRKAYVGWFLPTKWLQSLSRDPTLFNLSARAIRSNMVVVLQSLIRDPSLFNLETSIVADGSN